MAKPICLIKIDFQNLMQTEGHKIDIPKTQDGITKHLENEYHVIVVPQYDKPDEPIGMTVFYEKDFTEIQYNELKELIQKYLDESNTVSPSLA